MSIKVFQLILRQNLCELIEEKLCKESALVLDSQGLPLIICLGIAPEPHAVRHSTHSASRDTNLSLNKSLWLQVCFLIVAPLNETE